MYWMCLKESCYVFKIGEAGALRRALISKGISYHTCAKWWWPAISGRARKLEILCRRKNLHWEVFKKMKFTDQLLQNCENVASTMTSTFTTAKLNFLFMGCKVQMITSITRSIFISQCKNNQTIQKWKNFYFQNIYSSF